MPPPTENGTKSSLRGAAHSVEQSLAAFVRGCDVEQNDFVGAFARVACGELGGIAGVDEIDELHALDDAAGVDVETGDDAFGQHAAPDDSRKLRRICRPVAPDFSGWNCTPKTLPRSTAAAKGSM